MLTIDERAEVIARLDEGHIRELALKARGALMTGKAVELCYQPGDMTWYSLTIVPLEQVLGAKGGGGIPGEEPRSYMKVTKEGLTYAVMYAQQGTAMWFKPGIDNPYWSADKLIDNRASATAIGCLLEEIFGFSGD